MDIKEYFNYKESEYLPETNKSVVTKWFINYILSKINRKPKRAKSSYKDIFLKDINFTKDDVSKILNYDYDKGCKALMTKKLLIYNGEFSSRIDISKLDNAVREISELYHNSLTPLCIEYFKCNFPNFNKEDYINCLLSESWRTETSAKQSGGNWICPEWEMYLHWCKLCALGGTDDDIRKVYNKITTEEPVINLSSISVISPENWRNFRGWCTEEIDPVSDVFTISNANSKYSYKVNHYVPPGDVITSTVSTKYAEDYVLGSGFKK